MLVLLWLRAGLGLTHGADDRGTKRRLRRHQCCLFEPQVDIALGEIRQ
jgi:hypothetical protein